MNLSLVKQLIQDLNCQIEVTQIMKPGDKISARSNGEQSVGGGRKLLSETFSLFNLFSLFSLTL